MTRQPTLVIYALDAGCYTRDGTLQAVTLAAGAQSLNFFWTR